MSVENMCQARLYLYCLLFYIFNTAAVLQCLSACCALLPGLLCLFYFLLVHGPHGPSGDLLARSHAADRYV